MADAQLQAYFRIAYLGYLVCAVDLAIFSLFLLGTGETLMMFSFFFYPFVAALVLALSMTVATISNGMLWTFAVCSVLVVDRLSLAWAHVYPGGWWTDTIVMQCVYVLVVISGSVYRRKEWCIRDAPRL